MKISVVIPSFDRAHKLSNAIDSVLRQSRPAHEIIVVDDGSKDDTARVLKKYDQRIRVITNSENRGVSYSRNRGIEIATGEWLAFLDSDDLWHPEKLNDQTIFHETHPELKISQCDEIWIRNNVRVNPMKKHAKQGGWIFKACLPRCIVSPSSVIIHRSVLDHVGLFDENLPACEDYDLWLRIAPYYEIGFLPRQLVTRYGGADDQLSRKYWGMDRFRVTAMEKQLLAPLNKSWRLALLDELVFKCGIVADGANKRNNSVLESQFLEKKHIYQELLDREK